MSLPIIVVGAGGRMGKTICGLVQESDAMTLAGMVERREFQPAAPEGCLVSDDLDAVAAGRYETALQILHILLRRQEEPVVILATIGSQLRRIVEANRLRAAGKGKNDLMKLCSVSSYPAQKAMEFSRRLSAEFPEKAVELCLEADRRMKTSFDDPKRVLELLVLQLAEEAAHA